jgi:CreA protein
MMKYLSPAVVFSALVLAIGSAQADDIACISTTFRLIGPNDKVCVSAFDDPKVTGVACHISQARTGGLKGTFGLAEDPSQFSIACRHRLIEMNLRYSRQTILLHQESLRMGP